MAPWPFYWLCIRASLAPPQRWNIIFCPKSFVIGLHPRQYFNVSGCILPLKHNGWVQCKHDSLGPAIPGLWLSYSNFSRLGCIFCLSKTMPCVGPEVHFLVKLICPLPFVPHSFLTLVTYILHLASLEQVRGDLILYVVCPVKVAHKYVRTFSLSWHSGPGLSSAHLLVRICAARRSWKRSEEDNGKNLNHSLKVPVVLYWLQREMKF